MHSFEPGACEIRGKPGKIGSQAGRTGKSREREAIMDQQRERFFAAAWNAAWSAGRAMTLEQVVEYVLVA